MLPQRIKLASTLFMVAAAFGVCTGIFFKARGTLTWPLFVGVLLVDALYLWIGISLRRRRGWALVAGRLFTALALLGGVLGLFGFGGRGPSNINPLLLTAIRLTQLGLAVAIVVALFQPELESAFDEGERPA